MVRGLWNREEALVEHLAETFHVIFGDVDFTASDRHAALVLATALQQRRRQEHIKECLKGGKHPCVGFLPYRSERKPQRVSKNQICRKCDMVIRKASAC